MKVKKSLIILVLLFATILGFVSIAPSVIKNTDDGFNATNAVSHIKEISKEPHSVFDYEEHENVRNYIINTAISYVGQSNVFERNYLTASNKNPNTNITYVDTDLLTINNMDAEYDIRNVLVTVKGKSDMGILLCAHYDSRGHIGRFGELGGSYGAGDDGYGVATMLEIMRYVSSIGDLENSIYFLFSDGEEKGMYGSFLEARNEELMNNVNFVVNIEARGIKGAAYMFETSLNNNKVIEMYKKSSDKVSYSVAPAVYSVMPNYTDFSNFVKVGKQGLNFSVLDSIEYYHTPSDNYSNVNVSSVQHYGEQILPIVIEYVMNEQYSTEDYFVGNHDMVFFNSLPGLFIIYSSTFATILSIICLLGLAAIIIYLIKTKKYNGKEFGKQMLIITVSIIGVLVLGYLLSLIVARLQGYRWNIANVRCQSSMLIFSLYVIAFICCLIYSTKKLNNKKDNMYYYLLASVTINSVLNLFVSFTLSGASFLFLIPSILGLGYIVIDMFVEEKIYKTIMFFVCLFIIVLIFVPLIYSLLLALTIGGALALGLLTLLPITSILPMAKNYLSE